eukprot:scaffold10220_cov272-Chaetoceros_neogracile.AAC.25
MAAADDKKPDASCVICCSFTCPCFKVKWEKLMSISRVSSKWLKGALCYNLLSIWDHSHVGQDHWFGKVVTTKDTMRLAHEHIHMDGFKSFIWCEPDLPSLCPSSSKQSTFDFRGAGLEFIVD